MSTPARRRLPRATYRVQLNRDFTFADATRIVPYLARLGISHLYTSPILKARPGSMHGYDVVDHTMLNPEIGTQADFGVVDLYAAQPQLRCVIDKETPRKPWEKCGRRDAPNGDDAALRGIHHASVHTTHAP